MFFAFRNSVDSRKSSVFLSEKTTVYADMIRDINNNAKDMIFIIIIIIIIIIIKTFTDLSCESRVDGCYSLPRFGVGVGVGLHELSL